MTGAATIDLCAWGDAALALALKAGRRILEIYATDFAARLKPDQSPVTEADEAAEAVILAGLAQLVPAVPAVAEESLARGAAADISGGRFWLVDPLDGTREFLARNGEFSVNIGLVIDGQPALGVVHQPTTGISYLAAGAGAFRVERDGHRRPIQARRPSPQGFAVLASRSHLNPETESWLAREPVSSTVRMGSAIKFGLIAEGRADLYARLGPTREWDTAAGHAILAAAGGSVRTVDGAPLGYGKADFANSGFIARGRDPV